MSDASIRTRALVWAAPAALFLYATVVQFNDPDPVRWELVYASAALACGLAIVGRTPAWLPAVVGVAAAVWAGLWLPRALDAAFTFDEEQRELGGLLIVAVCMAVLFWRARRR